MGDYVRFDTDSDISINPPLNWGQIKGTMFLEDMGRDCYLLVEEISKETDTGTNTTKTSSFIVLTRDSGPRSYRNVESEIREIIKKYPEHRFDGILKGITEGFDTDEALWGILVVNNVVTRIKPTITWPGDDA